MARKEPNHGPDVGAEQPAPDLTELLSLIPDHYHAALRGAVKPARAPGAVIAAIRALGPGGVHRVKGATWEIIGHALQDCLAGEGYQQRRLEVFVTDLVRRGNGKEPPVGVAGRRETVHEKNERVLAGYMEAHRGE